MKILGFLCIALQLAISPSGAFEEAAPGACATCHPAARVRWSGGVHAKEGLVCVDCHQGDSGVLDAEAGCATGRRFERAEQIARVCGNCHAAVAQMQPYNLAVDQLALYRESAHGRARLADNEDAPVCTDCHENHRVLAITDPSGPAFGTNLGQTCGRCHADAILAEENELDVGVITGFSTSPHGRALLSRLNQPAPSCANCHDAHGAAVPRNADIDEICGACHEETRASLRAGSHRAVLALDELAGCASCHGIHAGLEARDLNEICADCHAQDSPQIDLGKRLALMLRQARDEVAAAEAAVLRARRIPLSVRDHEGLVAEAQRYLLEAKPRLHSFQQEPIEQLTRAASSLALRVQDEVDGRLQRKSARLGLLFVWLYSAITLVVLLYLRDRALDRGSA